MNRMRLLRWSFATATAASLVFGSTQAFAAPGGQRTGTFCNPIECRNHGCGVGWGCGGTCVNDQCECDC